MATIDTSLFPSANVRFQMAELPSGPNIDPLAIQQQKLANQVTAQNLATAKQNAQKAKLADAMRDVMTHETPEDAIASIDRHVADGTLTPEQAADAKSKVPVRGSDGSLPQGSMAAWRQRNFDDYLATNEQLYESQTRRQQQQELQSILSGGVAPAPATPTNALAPSAAQDDAATRLKINALLALNTETGRQAAKFLEGQLPKPMTEYQQTMAGISQQRLNLTEAQLKAKKPSDAAVQQVADMLQAGMAVPMGTGSEFRAAVYGELRNRGASGIDLASAKAAFGGEQQSERTLGATSANQLAASEEAIPMIGIARNYVDRVDTGKFKSVNAISNWAATHTGDKDIIALNTALNSLVNSYARAISPKGIPTVSDKNHAREILDAALSKGQLNTALDVMEQEMQAARTGTTTAKAQIRGQTTSPAAGGGAQTPPQVGEVRKGYKFKGGNPSDANNWEKVK